jgi:hypothetical protein
VPEPRGFEVVDTRAGSQASVAGFDSALGACWSGRSRGSTAGAWSACTNTAAARSCATASAWIVWFLKSFNWAALQGGEFITGAAEEVGTYRVKGKR